MTDGVVRARFAEGQFLGADDLVAEQTYRDGAARRHVVGGHSWGVVRGLELSARADTLVVGAGFAVDGHGRGLVVTDGIDVSLDDLPDGTRDVYLAAVVDERDGRERTRVCFARPGRLDPRWPAGSRTGHPVGAAGHERPVARASLPPWPVHLGRLIWADGDLDVDPQPRVLAGLVGEHVRSVSGRARLRIGVEGEADAIRFGLATAVPRDGDPPRDDVPDDDIADHDASADLQDRLSIRREGSVTVHGRTRIRGHVAVIPTEEPAPDRHAGMRFRPAPTPEAAAPWTLYRTEVEAGGRTARQLRIEIGQPGDDGDPRRHRFVIGGVGSEGFVPCLAVDAGCRVTVGDLTVQGLLVEGPIAADLADPRFAGAAAQGFVEGITRTADQLDTFHAAALSVAVSAASDQAESGRAFPYVVTVTNTGSAAATHGQVHVVAGIGDDTIASGPETEGATVEPGAPLELELSVDVPTGRAGETLTIAATALAVGPAGNVIDASASASWDIEDPVIID